MPFAQSSDVSLHYEDRSSGPPVLFVHELASDLRQWRGPIEALQARFRCIGYDARGYPPSDVPDEADAYRWERFAADIGAVLDHVGVERAALVGWSMGAYAALQFARLHPRRVAALALVGVGSGSPPGEREGWQAQMRALAEAWRVDPRQGAALIAATPGRQPLKRADPAAFAAWLADLEGHSGRGMALTCANYQGLRPSLELIEPELARLEIPTLLMVGEEDPPCLAATGWLARTLPDARLLALPGGGHAPMLEDPAGFNRALEAFLLEVGLA
jgi:pimeloyl-ACP methyl ester carboxylesterase